MLVPFTRWPGAASAAALVMLVAASPATAQSQVEVPARDRPLEGGLTEVFAIGSANGEDWETFSNVPSVAFDAAGSLYVLDRDNARVMVYDRTGRFVRQVGRKGQGPGELGLPMQMTVMPDGRVVVFDLVNNALVVFGADGAYETLVRAPFGVRAGGTGGMRAHPSGGVVVPGSQLPDVEAGGPAQMRETLPLLLIPLAGGEARTLYEAPSPPPQLQTSGGENRREVRVGPPPTFSPQVRFDVLPDGRLAVTHGTDYAVHMVADGRVGTTLTRAQAARRVTDPDRESAKEQRAEALRSGAGAIRMENVNGVRTASVGGQGLPEAEVQRSLESMQFAETVPVIRGLATDRQGRIWVAREGGPGRAGEGPVDLLMADGRYVGTVSDVPVPDAFGPDGLAAFIEAGELDVPRIVVRRIPAGWR